jgi:hypothetical protein
MPKKSGDAMPPLKHAPPLRPPSRSIKSFAGRADGPHRHPEQHSPSGGSNALAAEAVRKAKNPGSIDPRQMRNSDPSNID